MTVREMHIEINQSLQKVAANLTRKYLSEEIDWVLNKIQTRYIESLLRPVDLADTSNSTLFGKTTQEKSRFADQIHTDAIRTLTVTFKDIEAWTDPNVGGGVVSCYLPDNYMFLMSDVSSMNSLCGAAPIVTTSQKYYTVLNLSKSTLSAPPYYTANNSITIGTKTLNIPAGLPDYNNYTGFSSKNDVMFLKDYILSRFRERGVTIYWEWYGDQYWPNSFIIPCDASGITATLLWDGVDVTDASLKSFTISKRSLPSGVPVKTKLADNRLTSSYDIPTSYTPYYGPSIVSPVSELSGHVLKVYHDDNTIVNKVVISYIRTPRPISLSLGLNCELPHSACQKICDLAVEYIKGQQEDATGVTIKKQDNDSRIIL